MKNTITAYRQNATEILAHQSWLNHLNQKDCVYLCMGTSRVVSDSLGPKVGTLIKKANSKLVVFGTEEFNVTALNLKKAINFIKTLYPTKKVVVVDSAVGDITEVGTIQVKAEGIFPGLATDKHLPKVGDYSVIGVICKKGSKNFYDSSLDRISVVDKMAHVIANSILCKKTQ